MTTAPGVPGPDTPLTPSSSALSGVSAFPAPIVGANTLQAGETQLAALATALFGLLGALLAVFKPQYLPGFDHTVPYAEAIVVAGAALAHTIRDHGVTSALAAERVALISNGWAKAMVKPTAQQPDLRMTTIEKELNELRSMVTSFATQPATDTTALQQRVTQLEGVVQPLVAALRPPATPV